MNQCKTCQIVIRPGRERCFSCRKRQSGRYINGQIALQHIVDEPDRIGFEDDEFDPCYRVKCDIPPGHIPISSTSIPRARTFLEKLRCLGLEPDAAIDPRQVELAYQALCRKIAHASQKSFRQRMYF